MKFFILTVIFVVLNAADLSAQCAMCRSTLENNVSNGNPGIAAGINMGILYLLVLPYLAVMVIGFLWYKSTRHGR
jgi:hypothetical protein